VTREIVKEEEDDEDYINSLETGSDPLERNSWIDGVEKQLREKAAGLIKLFDGNASLRSRFAWYVYESLKAVKRGRGDPGDKRLVYYVWNELGHMVDVSCFKP
jgi:hypothetical protein